MSPDAIAAAAHVPAERVEENLRSWSGVFWDDQGRINAFWGMAVDRLEPTHRIEVNRRSVYGWCAWDTLFITEMLGEETQVETADPVTGETIRLTVTPHGVEAIDPKGAVMSFLLPDRDFGADVIQSFCHFVFFFASERSAQRWMADHPGTFLLSIRCADRWARSRVMRPRSRGPPRPGRRCSSCVLPLCVGCVRPRSRLTGETHDARTTGSR